MQQTLSVDMRGGHRRARVTVAGQVTRRNWMTLLRTLEATAAMYSDITIDVSQVTRFDAGVFEDLVDSGRWLGSREGRLEVARMAPLTHGNSRPRDRFLVPVDPIATLLRAPFTGSVMENEEVHAVELVSVRLRERYPEVSPEVIDEVVAGYHHEFDGRPIRDFVPILVERQARDHLRTFPKQRNRQPRVQHP